MALSFPAGTPRKSYQNQRVEGQGEFRRRGSRPSRTEDRSRLEFRTDCPASSAPPRCEAARPSRAPAGVQAAIALLLPVLLLGCAGLGTDSGGAVDPVDYIEVLPILTRDTTTGARRVTIWTGLLVAGEAPDLEAQALEEVGEGAWLVKGANAAMTLFPTRDFTVVGAPALVLLPDQAGSVTVGRVGEEDELESGYRLEVTAAPAEDDGVRLSVRFIQSEAGVEVRTVRDVDVVVPKRGSLFLATRATEAALR